MLEPCKIFAPNRAASNGFCPPLLTIEPPKNTGVKIKKIGDKILKKTIKELDKYILNEFKKT